MKDNTNYTTITRRNLQVNKNRTKEREQDVQKAVSLDF